MGHTHDNDAAERVLSFSEAGGNTGAVKSLSLSVPLPPPPPSP